MIHNLTKVLEKYGFASEHALTQVLELFNAAGFTQPEQLEKDLVVARLTEDEKKIFLSNHFNAREYEEKVEAWFEVVVNQLLNLPETPTVHALISKLSSTLSTDAYHKIFILANTDRAKFLGKHYADKNQLRKSASCKFVDEIKDINYPSLSSLAIPNNAVNQYTMPHIYFSQPDINRHYLVVLSPHDFTTKNIKTIHKQFPPHYGHLEIVCSLAESVSQQDLLNIFFRHVPLQRQKTEKITFSPFNQVHLLNNNPLGLTQTFQEKAPNPSAVKGPQSIGLFHFHKTLTALNSDSPTPALKP
ncbi:MAG: hypothetical protein H0W64_09480 [Gammaproteobacteria bacterium]|nr:hypothetical protein [Gammaproteobacteria bacterium]